MNRNDFKEAAGISATSIAKLDKGTNITTDVLLKIYEAMDCKLEDIMETIYLDIDCNQILHLCKIYKRLAKVIKMVGPITYSVSNKNPYVFLVHEIIEQMLFIKAGAKIFGRLDDLC
jgi:hypothetical protein